MTQNADIYRNPTTNNEAIEHTPKKSYMHSQTPQNTYYITDKETITLTGNVILAIFWKISR